MAMPYVPEVPRLTRYRGVRLRVCPFCRKYPRSIDRAIDGDQYAVCCWCGACGPFHHSKIVAAKAWNSRLLAPLEQSERELYAKPARGKEPARG
jgi:hypothetical protein